MPATVLSPLSSRLHAVTGRRRPGPPSLSVRGAPMDVVRSTTDRIRAGLVNSGFPVPAGAVTLDVEPDTTSAIGLDLALCLAVLLVCPSHRHIRQPGLVAWGRVGLDGTLGSAPEPPTGHLPSGSWIARIWRPTDHIPEPNEDAFLSVIDVETVEQAWGAVVALLEIERGLEKMIRQN